MDNKSVIKAFNEYVDGFVECCTSDKLIHDLLKAVARLIEDQEERIAIMSEGGLWIPVKERLPEENISPITHDYTEVVCYTTFGDVRVYKFGEGHFFKGPGVMDHLVTHWQYLPEPPKEGEA